MTASMGEVYSQYSDQDGFLYMTYSSQDMFGWSHQTTLMSPRSLAIRSGLRIYPSRLTELSCAVYFQMACTEVPCCHVACKPWQREKPMPIWKRSTWDDFPFDFDFIYLFLFICPYLIYLTSEGSGHRQSNFFLPTECLRNLHETFNFWHQCCRTPQARLSLILVCYAS